ncbi:Delta-9 acyl-phospholipid desaturase [Paucimonas lemoignei]|uniref:Delta-9 acyl-phospholipid desaturase n=1 Tax=Paucimonas lemoignei TaxID=29443 RepID=A0A4R3HXW1_PAULE|nr:fatty acid desaturase [Paucimonas lemoignei]TCS37045.1 Delta-9 acyl-phospholipid desaturase [Paucimonas lemoignei]
MYSGFIQLTPMAKFLIIMVSMQISFMAVSLYLHRGLTHGAISFHPVLSHFFRLWLWLTTAGLVRKQWVAVHRKHHAKCDTVDDPHSPQIHGIGKLLTQGTLLYRKAARCKEVVQMYGLGVKEDWMDRVIYAKHPFIGAPLFLIIEMMLFGVSTGAMIWIFQVITVPFWASGFVNGLAHYLGYRNNVTRDASRNLIPLGIFLCGEELHNNHHARPGSAKLSQKWWEFDMGWVAIRLFSLVGLIKVNRI